jgi:rubrerythrin
VLIDIANEERVHAGEFARLLSILTGDEDEYLTRGAKEVDVIAAEIGQPSQETKDKGMTTIGSLKPAQG